MIGEGGSLSGGDAVQSGEPSSAPTDASTRCEGALPVERDGRVSAARFAGIAKAASDLGERRRPMSEIARLYTEAGVPVFPAKPHDKKPFVSGGFHARSKDLKQVDRWWSEWPHAIVGIVPGDFALVALDVDSPDAVQGFIDAGLLTIEQLDTLTSGSESTDVSVGLVVETGGVSEPFEFEGRSLRPMHVYLAYGSPDEPPGLPKGAVQRFSKGYVIAPGSWRTTENGDVRLYCVVSADNPVAYVRCSSSPQVVEASRNGRAPKPAVTYNGSKDADTGLDVLEGAAIPLGRRHELLRAASVRIAQHSVSEAEVRNLLRCLDQAQCQPPIQAEDGLAEIDALALSAWRKHGNRTLKLERLGNAQLESLLAATDGLMESPGAIQEWVKHLAATMAALTHPVEVQVALEVCKTKLAQVLGIQGRDAERILAKALAHPNAESPDTAYGRAYTLRDLAEHPDWLQSPEAAIPYLAWPGLKTLFSAREKAGKSTLAMSGAAAVSRGASFLGTEVQRRRVLWVSEEPLSVVMRRAKEMEADPEYFAMLPIARHPLAALDYHAERHGAQVVVIDTLYRLALSSVTDENDSAQWGPVFEQLDSLTRGGKAVLLLAHATKSSKAGEYRGSTAIGGFVDVIVSMKTPESDDVARKLDVVGRVPTEPITVRLTMDGFELLTRGRVDLTVPIQEQVLQFVERHPGCNKTVVRNGVPFRAVLVDAAIAELELGGRITDDPAGKTHRYYVPPKRPELDFGLGGFGAKDEQAA